MSDEPKDFKLLAIRPRKGCHTDYCKNLGEELLYQFYSLYDFEKEQNQPYKITPSGNDHGLFNKYVQEKKKLNINVSAIVGKNGSGKSSLTELLFICCYLVAVKNHILTIDATRKDSKEQRQFMDMLSRLKFELYYVVDRKYYCIAIDDQFTAPQHPESNILFIDLWKADHIPMASFFYSIAINYSIYGLNESTTGPWVGRLFHKNDGYQTPVVINPFRNNGTINITGEIHFAQTRLLANLMLNHKEEVEIIPGKKVTELTFVIDSKKLSRIEEHSIDRVREETEDANELSWKVIFNKIYETLLGSTPKDESIADPRWRELTINYVIGKLIRIAMNYEEYSEFLEFYSEERVPGLKNIDQFLAALKNDHTHITLKIRQALNFYKYDPLRMDREDITLSNDRISIPIRIFSEKIRACMDANPEADPMEFVPIAPFTPRLTLETGIQFHKLSSGEQQYINSIQSIIYHILNLNSVFNNKKQSSKITFDCINIILDEIELYFHPEFQRIFVRDLLQTVSNLETPNIKGINILFLTHSPFILSDIPAINVLRIKPGEIEEEKVPTFAGNIHQMLASSFFMEATSGEFARDQYRDIIKFYETIKYSKEAHLKQVNDYHLVRNKFKFIVSQIGEAVIKGVLENHLQYLDEKLLFDELRTSNQRQAITSQIALLNQQLKDLDDKD